MGYYADRLNAERLKQCYEIAPPRVQQYLAAEIAHVLTRIPNQAHVLELGCGYGRVLAELVKRAKTVTGIDTSHASLALANETIRRLQSCRLVKMDAVKLGFPGQTFDAVICIQNGISAFHVNQRDLIQESIRVTRPGGIVLFSSYAESFWSERLHWFRLQAAAGLIGEIDNEKTQSGTIVCKDGFTATTVTPEQFHVLTSDLKARVQIHEVDQSSLFCEITVV